MTEITFMSKGEIADRRSFLLQQAGLDLESLRERGATYQLSPEQMLILKELENLEFLASA